MGIVVIKHLVSRGLPGEIVWHRHLTKQIYLDGIIRTGHGECLTTPEQTLPIKAL